jgi:ubiquinone/menaquinone biosynthesis C-methylase UbiE
MVKRQPNLSFKGMSLMFRVRDLVRPRKDILIDAGIGPGASVLDFGCGPGGYILPLAKLVGPSGRIYALDINPAAVATVRGLAARRGLANVETILSDGPTGLPDASLDFVLAYDVFHHLSQPGHILAEWRRVLKPAGILSVTDHHLKEDKITAGVTASGLFKLSRKGKKVYNFSRA